MEYLVWVGPRDSDIQFSKCFKESICYFLKNPNSDRKAHIYGNSYIEFIKNKMENLLEFHPEARFIFIIQNRIWFKRKFKKIYSLLE